MVELVEPSQIRSQGSPAFRSVQQGSGNTCRVQMSLGGKRQSRILEDILRRAPNAFAALAIRRATSSAEQESGVMTLPR